MSILLLTDIKKNQTISSLVLRRDIYVTKYLDKEIEYEYI